MICGYLSIHYGYRFGFFAAGLGMLIGQLLFNVLGERFLGDIGKTPALVENCKSDKKKPLSQEEKDRTRVILILVLFCVFFWAGFEQAGSSMTLYTEKFINRTLFGFNIPTSWFMSINPLFIVLFAPLFSLLWMWLNRRGREPSVPVKMGMGMILLGIGFLLMFVACVQRGGNNPDVTVKANLLFLVGAYLLHTFGELSLSPIGLSMVTKLSPLRLASLMMGVWFMSSFIANLAGGVIASYASRMGAMEVFAAIAGASVVLGLVLISLNKWLVTKSHGKF